MSAYSFAYLFDYSGFKRKIEPALEELLNGTPVKLQNLAIEAVKNNPKVWRFIDFSRIYFYNHNFKKEIDSVVNGGVLLWLLLVISEHCSEMIAGDVELLILRDVSVKEKPLGDMLTQIAPRIIPTDYVVVDFNINDCPMYWLDITDLEKIKAVMLTDIQQKSTPASDSFLSVLDQALVTQKNVIIGTWFGM